MTRLEIRDAVGQELNKNTSSMDSATAARLLGYINRRYRALQSAPGLQHLRQAVLTLTAEADRAFYGIPSVASIQRIWDVSNNRFLGTLTLDQYRRVDPRSLEESGTPEAWVWSGHGQIAKQPENKELSVDSTAAGDTGTAYIEVRESSNNVVRPLSVTMTGTTAAAFADTQNVYDVAKFYLSTNAVGTVTLVDTTTGTIEYARIGIGTKSTRYAQIYLWRTPSSALSYSLDVTREILDLAQDTDEPWLPLDFHDLIVYGAVADEYRHLDDDRSQHAERLYRERLGALKYFLAESPTSPVAMNADGIGISQLGGWFPADS